LWVTCIHDQLARWVHNKIIGAQLGEALRVAFDDYDEFIFRNLRILHYASSIFVLESCGRHNKITHIFVDVLTPH